MGKDSDFEYEGKELGKEFKLKDGKLKYLVTGTGRCGTVFLAKFLSSIGIPCVHEGVFYKDGIEGALARMRGESSIEISDIAKMASVVDEQAGWRWFNKETTEVVADSSYMAAPFLDHPSLEDTTIIHVVREPMAVVNSFIEGLSYFRDECLEEDYMKEYHEFIYDHVPSLRQPLDCLSRAALYYIKWNEMIERLSKGRRYYLHHIEKSVDGLMEFLGLPMQPHYDNRESNHKIGLHFQYDDPSCIATLAIRRKLEAIHQRYYSKT